MVNLEYDKSTGDSVQLDFSDRVKDSLTPQLLLSILIKLGMIAVAPAVLMAYENYNISILNNQLEQLNQELNVQKQEISKIDKQISSYAHLEEKSNEFKGKLEALEELAQDRIAMIKILDNIQGEFKREEGEGRSKNFMFLKNISIQKKRVKIQGTATNENIIQSFVRSLEDGKLYEEIFLEGIQSQGSEKLKNFSITGDIVEKI